MIFLTFYFPLATSDCSRLWFCKLQKLQIFVLYFIVLYWICYLPTSQETHSRQRPTLQQPADLQPLFHIKNNRTCCQMSAYWSLCFQSVLNAAAQSIAGLQRSDHITDTLASFHWLKVLEHIQFKLATIVYRSLNGTAPQYLAADLCRFSDMTSRRRLRSSLTDQLDVRQSQCSTVGDRAFTVAGARLWNSLPHDFVASDTLSIQIFVRSIPELFPVIVESCQKSRQNLDVFCPPKICWEHAFQNLYTHYHAASLHIAW